MENEKCECGNYILNDDRSYMDDGGCWMCSECQDSIIASMNREYNFSHIWVKGFGWENTILHEEDFETVEIMGKNDEDGTIFCCYDKKSSTQIIKGSVI